MLSYIISSGSDFFHHYDNYFHMPTHKQEELHQARLSELDQMTGERDTARGEFETMRKQRLDEFMAGFSTITNKLKEMYQVRSLSTFISSISRFVHLPTFAYTLGSS